MIGAYMRRSAQFNLFISLTYFLLAALLFNRDGGWLKFKQIDHQMGLLGINAQGSDAETCDYEFSIWEEEEEHGEDCDNTLCNGSCLLMGYGTQTSHCLTEEICCCNYDTVPTAQPLPEVEPENYGSDDDLAPTDEAIPIPCEDTAMEEQEPCVHATCGQACQEKGFLLAASMCYKTGSCCCNNQQPCHKFLWLRYIGGTCNDRACKHMCHIAKFSGDASSCFHQDLCCCKYG